MYNKLTTILISQTSKTTANDSDF